ncbi:MULTISPECIES: YitT family protein [Brevibacillus]|uniref:YitT family protein n=1 Tax=Brevibacillus invocatus TaxID=173959 RepID=A0A3M8CK47_9BACL|nr:MULTISPECIES: YitT family protein [Brevibacillus]MCM3078368.1 YitT family protein [Brevibacillus invocatus]MCM3428477.1 YitT family protein [Brevibacillus invocatus]MDH4616847.1 YitT family protein [Brevibacillus sp. AY1]RNB76122.1 YitT family protein [Brevibacillus invocatus]
MKRALQFIQRYGMILFGACLLAFAYYHINFQNHLSEGGFVGLGLLAKYIFDLSPALMMLALDIPLILVAWLVKGRQFIWNTVVASLSFTGFYELFEKYSPIVLDMSSMMPLASLLSGVLTGLGTGLVLRFGAATGGDDILSLLLSKYTGLTVGTIFLLMDVMVLSLSFWYLPAKEMFYTILAVVISSRVINWSMGLGAAPQMEAHQGHGHGRVSLNHR